MCLGAGGRLEEFVGSLRSVMAHTPPSVTIVVHGRGISAAMLERVVDRERAGGTEPATGRIAHLAPDAGDLLAVVAAAAPADVVVVAAGCVVAPEWLTRLRAAAGAGGRGGGADVATASALDERLLTAAEPDADAAVPGAQAAARVAAAALRLRPRLAEPHGPCVYVRRSAIELAGEPSGPFTARCVELGLAHVLADDVLVSGTGGGSLVPTVIADAEGRPAGAMARSVGVARRTVEPLTVIVDARILAGPPDGTRRHVAEVIAAVASTGRAQVTALVAPGLHPDMRVRLERAPDVRLAGLDDDPPPHADVVHRPHQVSSPADLGVLAALGDRLVITQQDLISFHNPAYFPSRAGWLGYRALTRRALGAADRALFFSDHARGEALAEELVEPDRAEVLRIGTDHGPPSGDGIVPAPPPGAAALGAEEMILCLGADYLHKNRLFAMRMVAQLQGRHRWPGRLVLAGPHVAHGSSRPAERAFTASDPSLAAAILELGPVTESERAWLLDRAALVVYPTVHEGFGLIPYEAAAHDRPCLWAPGTALSELLPDAAAGIVAWDAAAAAERALELLRDPASAAELVTAVREAGAALRWEAAGHALVDAYAAVCDGAPTPAAALERRGGVMGGELSEDAIRLVGPGGALPRELERPLLALLTRPRLARPVGAAMRAGYRASRRRAGD